jgi:hypothetical protein
MKKYQIKSITKKQEIKETQKLKSFVSRCIPEGPEGQLIRILLFGNGGSITLSNKDLKKVILNLFPEENLNSEFTKIG